MSHRITKGQRHAIKTLLTTKTKTEAQRAQEATRVREAFRTEVQREIETARKALMRLFREGPLQVSPTVLAEAEQMSDAEVLHLKYEMRDLLRAIAKGEPVTFSGPGSRKKT